MNWESTIDQATHLLQDLLRFNTTNPPGNETLCAEYIAQLFKQEGFEPIVIESAPGRGNVVARLKGDGSQPPLLLMGHIDVVPAEADKWKRPPFSGDLVDGVVWGRGATDMKNMVAMEIMTMLLLKRENIPLKRDVIFMATADEETGGRMGAGFMADNHPDLIRAEYAINEGGATSIDLGGKFFYVCSNAEKGSARFTLRGRGNPGHASQPIKHHAMLPLAKAIVNLIEKPLPLRITKTAQAHVKSLSNHVDADLAKVLLELLEPDTHERAMQALPMADATKRRLYAALHNTAVPTILHGGTKINVIPATAECDVDCRILPGTTFESLEKELRGVVGNEVEIDFGPMYNALESDPASPLFETISQVIGQHTNGGIVVPGLITGGTDAKSITRIGTKVYGFVPQKYEGPDMVGLAHSHNERVSVANIDFGVRVLYDVVKEFCRH
jgi:acetylornithine deacetylase/succinyl-diaminopimelate desuccinylase-like protein